MRIGMIGLGKMGANMTRAAAQGRPRGRRLRPERRRAGTGGGQGRGHGDHAEELAGKLTPPRAAWVMVPAGAPTNDTIDELAGLFAAGRRHRRRRELQLQGGPGHRRAPGLERDRLRRRRHLGRRVGPHRGLLPHGGRHQGVGGGGRAGPAHPGPRGRLRPRRPGGCRPLREDGPQRHRVRADAGLRRGLRDHGGGEEFDLDLHEIASIWRYGSVVRSWLLELAERALRPDSGFEEIKAVVADSGEGRWTAVEAIDRGVPAPVISTSLFTRFASQEPDSFQLKMLAALRNQFGGHAVTLESGQAGHGDRDPDPLTPVAIRPLVLVLRAHPVHDVSRAFSDVVVEAFATRARAPASRWCSPAAPRRACATRCWRPRPGSTGSWSTSTWATSASSPPTTRTPTNCSSARPCSTGWAAPAPSPPCPPSARSTSAWPPTSARWRGCWPGRGSTSSIWAWVPTGTRPPSSPAQPPSTSHPTCSWWPPRTPPGATRTPGSRSTLPAIDAARMAVFTVAGASKAAGARRPRAWRGPPGGTGTGLPHRVAGGRTGPGRRPLDWRRCSPTPTCCATPLDELAALARDVRDRAHGRRVTYSPKVFIPLTMLCRDRCGYCTFAKAPARLDVALPHARGRAGHRPGRRRRRVPRGAVHPGRTARAALPRGRATGSTPTGTRSTVDYLAAMCRLVVEETGLLPHANAGALFRRRAGPAAPGDRQPGHDARVARPTDLAGPPRGTGQGAGAAAGHARGGR